MTTTPDTTPDPSPEDADTTDSKPGVEVGMSEGEGSTFEPEEDPEGHGAS